MSVIGIEKYFYLVFPWCAVLDYAVRSSVVPQMPKSRTAASMWSKGEISRVVPGW